MVNQLMETQRVLLLCSNKFLQVTVEYSFITFTSVAPVESQLDSHLRMSSGFPEHIRKYALDAHGINLQAESKAMVFNAEAEELVKFLDIGSRPAAMR
jgi:hypothetical protein